MKCHQILGANYSDFIKEKSFLNFLKLCGETRKSFAFILDGDDYDFSTLNSFHQYTINNSILVKIFIFKVKNGKIAIYNDMLNNKILKILFVEKEEIMPTKNILESF